MINFRSLILFFSVCFATTTTLLLIRANHIEASSLPVTHHHVFAENNRTKFMQQFLTSSSPDFDNEITFVALTNQGCGNCAFLHPIWNQVVSNLSQTAASANTKKHFKKTKTTFVWVECATAPSVCENSELFAQVAKYPYVAAFALFPSDSDHHTKSFIRLDGADGDGLKPMTDKTSGKSIGNMDSNNNNQHQEHDDQSEPDSDQEQMWSVERLLHVVQHVVNPIWNSQNNNNNKIKSASDVSRFLLAPFDTSISKPFLREPSSIFVVYFPRVDPNDNHTLVGRNNNHKSNNNNNLPLHSCTKISAEQQKLNQKAKGNVLRAASYLSLSSLEVESQYKFLWLEDNDDDDQQETAAEKVLVDLMTNSDTDGSKSNFYEVVTAALDEDNNEIVAEQQMSSKYPLDFTEEQKILRQLEKDFLSSLEGADEANPKFIDPETGKIINAEKHLKFQEAKTQLENHKAKLDSLEKSFTSSTIDSDNTNGVVSSFVAEFLNDRKNLHEDHCQFLSRPVIGILRCIEFVPVESAFNVSIPGSASSSSTSIKGRFCKQFSATWNWAPGTHNTSLSSAFYNHHQKENDDNNKNNKNRRDDLFVLSLVSPTLAPASILPRVTVVTDSAGERMFPGKIIDSLEPLSRAATRPFAFEKEEFHGTKHSQEISDQHHNHHHRHLFETTSSSSSSSSDNEKQKNNINNLHFNDYEIESHTQPIFAFFTETQTCQGRPSSYWPLVESVEKLASEYLNTTFVIFDGFKFSEFYLRAGLTRPVVDKMRLGMVIMDKGRKFSVIDALAKRNTTDDQSIVAYATGINRIQKNFPSLAFNEDAARLFLEYFWSGDKIRPFGKVVKIANHEDEIVRHLGQWKGMSVADAVALRDGAGLRLKTARKVLDFVAGKSIMVVTKNNDESIATPLVTNKVRLLLVESTFKESSKSFTRIFTKIFFEQQQQQQKEENDNQASQYYSKLLKHAEVAVVNGEGRGALALEHLYPERKSSMMPFIVCVDTTRSSSSSAADKNQERFFSSSPSFFQLLNASREHQFMQGVTKDEDRKLLLAEWLVNGLACFNKI